MEVGEAFDLISRAIDAGRVAHGYLIAGDVRGNCAELVGRILRKLYPDAGGQIDANSHPDVAMLEPEGKLRIITVDSIRERIVAMMDETSFSGSWKVGVICYADRMNEASSNAFLKSLEEPAEHSLYLLLTDQPDAILPTIVSRTQRIDLLRAEQALDGEDAEEVASAFAAKDAAALAAKLAELKDEVEDADQARVRKVFYSTIMGFVRGMMLSGKLPWYRAFRNVEAVEDAYRQSCRSMSDEAVLSLMLDRIVFP